MTQLFWMKENISTCIDNKQVCSNLFPLQCFHFKCHDMENKRLFLPHTDILLLFVRLFYICHVSFGEHSGLLREHRF